MRGTRDRGCNNLMSRLLPMAALIFNALQAYGALWKSDDDNWNRKVV